jgi:predicted protein tyrosine phosphatase
LNADPSTLSNGSMSEIVAKNDTLGFYVHSNVSIGGAAYFAVNEALSMPPPPAIPEPRTPALMLAGRAPQGEPTRMISWKAAHTGRLLQDVAALADSLRSHAPIGVMSFIGDPVRAGGERLNVLFACSRNQWRSRTGEQMWCRHPHVQARSAGTSASARRVVSVADLAWGDVVVAMEDEHRSRLLVGYGELLRNKPLHVRDIPDDYRYMDPELLGLAR